MKRSNQTVVLITLFLSVCVSTVWSQSTEFTYQGRLLDGALPPTANYDLEFRLFSEQAGGVAIGTLQRPGVAVSSGVFTVKLDFGASFDGSARWLEIAIKPAGSPDVPVTLNPRQPITSAPYSIRSLNSATADTSTNSFQLGGVAANQYVQTIDPRLSDPRNPLPNSPNYINNTTVQQLSSNFNVSGNGVLGGTLSANAITATTQFNIGINRALTLGTTSIFAGRLAGVSNTTGSGNTFVGDSAGRFNTTSSNNSFFGRDAGLQNTAADNSFFGAFAGDSNTTGARNAFFGRTAGDSNQSGDDNAFFGSSAGRLNIASENSFFGSGAGDSNTSGTANAFFGYQAGTSVATAAGNSFFGHRAGQANTASNNSFFGAAAGLTNTTGQFNAFFGTNAGKANTSAGANAFFGFNAGSSNTAEQNSFFGAFAGTANTTGTLNTFVGYSAGSQNSTGRGSTYVGFGAGQSNQTSDSNTFVGALSGRFNTSNDNSFFGSSAGGLNATGFFNSFFGSSAGYFNTAGIGNSFFGYLAGLNNTTGHRNTFIGQEAGRDNTTGNNNTLLGWGASLGSSGLTFASAIGSGSLVLSSNTLSLGRPTDTVEVPGKLAVSGDLTVVGKIFALNILGTAGSTDLCRNASGQISTCSSSLRYKTNVHPYTGGIDLVRRLRPVTFDWITDGARDIGFVAEEVNETEPLLSLRDRDGQIEGVKYKQITTVLVNAVKEQQQVIDDQRSEIDALKIIVCEMKPTALICRAKEEK